MKNQSTHALQTPPFGSRCLGGVGLLALVAAATACEVEVASSAPSGDEGRSGAGGAIVGTGGGAPSDGGGGGAGGEMTVDPCAPDPCLNGGTCSAVAALPMCDCEGTGFRGDTCHIPIPPSISVSWDDGATLGATDVAGLPPTTGWNNALGFGPGQADQGVNGDLLDAGGAMTGVSVSWACQDVEATTPSGGPSSDHTMMAMGCRSWTGQGDASFTFENLNAHFPDGYDVVVYIGRGGGFPENHTASFTLDVGQDSVTGIVMPSFDGTYDVIEGNGDSGNRRVSETHAEDTLTIALAATGGANLSTAAVNGVQFIAR